MGCVCMAESETLKDHSLLKVVKGSLMPNAPIPGPQFWSGVVGKIFLHVLVRNLATSALKSVEASKGAVARYTYLFSPKH